MPYKNFGNKDYPLTKQLHNNILPTVSLSLSYPVFNKFNYRTTKEKAKIKIADSEYILQQTQNALYFDIQQVYTDLKAAIAEYQSALEYLKSMQLSYKNIELKFSAGKISSYDYNLSKNKLMKAESEFLKAKFEIIFKQNILRYYQQLPLQI